MCIRDSHRSTFLINLRSSMNLGFWTKMKSTARFLIICLKLKKLKPLFTMLKEMLLLPEIPVFTQQTLESCLALEAKKFWEDFKKRDTPKMNLNPMSTQWFSQWKEIRQLLPRSQDQIWMVTTSSSAGTIELSLKISSRFTLSITLEMKESTEGKRIKFSMSTCLIFSLIMSTTRS